MYDFVFYDILNSEVNAGFFYKSAAEREKLLQAERAFTDQRVQKLIDFKKKVCDGTDKKFVLINQKASLSSSDICSYIKHKKHVSLWGLVLTP